MEEEYITGMTELFRTNDAMKCLADTGDLPPPPGCRAGDEGYAGYPAQCGY